MAYDNTNKGAIWNRTAKSWLQYQSGRLNVEGKEYNISLFKNNKDGNDARPDFNIVLEPVDGSQFANNSNNSQSQQPAVSNESSINDDISVEDIPF